MGNNNLKILAFIGSYADAKDSGLYVCNFDETSGSLELIEQASGLQNPTFLDVNANTSKLYAITEGVDADNQRCGAAAAYTINPSTGGLSLLNKENTVSAPTCHITLDHSGKVAIVSSYHGGMVGLSPLLEDGQIGTTADIQWHKSSSVPPVQARAHSVFIDRMNRFAVACDLGLDRLFIYKLDLELSRLVPHREIQTAAGSGPRHFAFHPALGFGYVIHELNATVTAFAYDGEQGELAEIQVISTLPDSYNGENGCADIHISPDGKFLYGSNRGHDSIVVYAIDQQTGKLRVVEHVSTLGGHPRNFGISPDGRFLLVANRDGNNIVTFRRDERTGKLQPTGSELHVSKPVCIKFARFEG
ncbi:lactonase family protein [Paenibacillus solisilvae]|uniref:Lactonase family protein n=1 Tax=Paenibacillus solisilvae TaxID=2486751 RepID=A0ABW0VQK9_9BACL